MKARTIGRGIPANFVIGAYSADPASEVGTLIENKACRAEAGATQERQDYWLSTGWFTAGVPVNGWIPNFG